MCITSVKSGHVGVVILFGAVSNRHLTSGLHIKNPLAKIVQTDIRLTAVIHASLAASRDLQIVKTEISVQYFLDGSIHGREFQIQNEMK